MGGSGRDALLYVGVELRPLRIDAVAGMNEPGIGDKSAHEIIERLVALHGFGQRGSRARRRRDEIELALVLFFKCNALGIRAVEIPRDLRVIHSPIKISEVPLRQLAFGGVRRGFGSAGAVS